MPKKKKIVKVMDIVPSVKKNSSKRIDHEPHMLRPVERPQEELVKELEQLRDEPLPTEFLREPDYGDTSFGATEDKPLRPKKHGKRKFVAAIVALILVVAAYSIIVRLPKVDVSITMKKSPVSYQESVQVKTTIGATNAASKEIPGEIISKKASKAFEYPASGQRDVDQKATGKIVIYNTYSSASQPLVATTRFEAPNGNIYRLVERVTVPGMSGGEPGMIETDIIADKAGPEYNTEGIARLEVPGFEGGDKYGKFYGQITDPVRGGIRGLAPYPTDEDIAKARQQAREQLRADLKALLTLQMPSELTYIRDSEDLQVTSEKVDTATVENGKFSVLMEGEMRIFAFKEADLRSFIKTLALQAQAIDESSVEKEFVISYKTPAIQYASGSMTVPLDIQAIYWKPLDADQLKKEIAGMRELDVKSAILEKEGVDKLSLSFWPFWVSRAPHNEGRISIRVE